MEEKLNATNVEVRVKGLSKLENIVSCYYAIFADWSSANKINLKVST